MDLSIAEVVKDSLDEVDSKILPTKAVKGVANYGFDFNKCPMEFEASDNKTINHVVLMMLNIFLPNYCWIGV